MEAAYIDVLAGSTVGMQQKWFLLVAWTLLSGKWVFLLFTNCSAEFALCVFRNWLVYNHPESRGKPCLSKAWKIMRWCFIAIGNNSCFLLSASYPPLGDLFMCWTHLLVLKLRVRKIKYRIQPRAGELPLDRIIKSYTSNSLHFLCCP